MSQVNKSINGSRIYSSWVLSDILSNKVSLKLDLIDNILVFQLVC
ncbi:hypothetical protein F383_09846 [Gossypium arboreum]|uniref:Uncharacterized protein n=1 Tax=Gossypium arboreum TaxID=29729 RepID=A0A0B0PQZ7_GOSAR|nr:hypothetical protein F383_09846 [Gossypium arboreum]